MKKTNSKDSHPTLADFFEIKRGLATGKNKYFILDIDEISGPPPTNGGIQTNYSRVHATLPRLRYLQIKGATLNWNVSCSS